MPLSEERGAFECAFVNNMPDGAFSRTERQFLRLLAPARRWTSVNVRRYTFPGRSRPTGYRSLDLLWHTTPDAVIVTGAQPLAARVDDEPYWPDLTHLLDWSLGHVRTVLLSCLAAHAALLHLDGLARVRLDGKLSGVFPQNVAAGHRLTAGLPARMPLPHSRYNDVPTEHLIAAGWDPLMWSDTAGWSVATSERGGCRLVLVQGHPEYDADTLLREYRRDLNRYHHDPGAEFPVAPQGYLGPSGDATLATYLAAGGARRQLDASGFPFEELARHLRHPWRRPALRLFDNLVAETSHSIRSSPAMLAKGS